MYQKFSFVAIQIQMIKFLSHKHTSTSLASLYWKVGERTNLQKGIKISVPLFLMIRLSYLTVNQGLLPHLHWYLSTDFFLTLSVSLSISCCLFETKWRFKGKQTPTYLRQLPMLLLSIQYVFFFSRKNINYVKIISTQFCTSNVFTTVL